MISAPEILGWDCRQAGLRFNQSGSGRLDSEIPQARKVHGMPQQVVPMSKATLLNEAWFFSGMVMSFVDWQFILVWFFADSYVTLLFIPWSSMQPWKHRRVDSRKALGGQSEDGGIMSDESRWTPQLDSSDRFVCSIASRGPRGFSRKDVWCFKTTRWGSALQQGGILTKAVIGDDSAIQKVSGQ